MYSFILIKLTYIVWRGTLMVRVLDLQSGGREFNSQPFHLHVTTQGKLTLFTHTCASVTEQYNLVTAKSL